MTQKNAEPKSFKKEVAISQLFDSPNQRSWGFFTLLNSSTLFTAVEISICENLVLSNQFLPIIFGPKSLGTNSIADQDCFFFKKKTEKKKKEKKIRLPSFLLKDTISKITSKFFQIRSPFSISKSNKMKMSMWIKRYIYIYNLITSLAIMLYQGIHACELLAILYALSH